MIISRRQHLQWMSFWKENLCPRFFEDRFSSKFALNEQSSLVFSRLNRTSFQLEPYSLSLLMKCMMLPPPCLTMGMVCSGWCAGDVLHNCVSLWSFTGNSLNTIIFVYVVVAWKIMKMFAPQYLTLYYWTCPVFMCFREFTRQSTEVCSVWRHKRAVAYDKTSVDTEL